MTPEKLQEAIGLLPSDLVAEADEKRNQLPKEKSQWKPIAAMAACFAVVLACGLFLTRMGMGGNGRRGAGVCRLGAHFNMQEVTTCACEWCVSACRGS